MNKLKACKLMALALTSAAPVFAQPRDGDWEFTLGGSGTANQDFNHGGFGVDAGLGYFFNPNLEVGVRQNLTYNSDAASEFSGSTRAAVDWHFQLGKFVPFVGANIGMIYNSDDITGELGPELGFKYYVHPETFIMVMGEYRWFFSDFGDIGDNADQGAFVFTVGIGFNFGRH
jgi:hypothetical protein